MLLHLEFNDWFWLVISVLCVWRITGLLCYEAGPFDILTKFRKIMYKLHLGRLVECFHCMGIWVAAIIVLLMFEPAIISFFGVFAVAGLASIIERFISK